MNTKAFLFIKLFLFGIIFYIICFLAAFILRDDMNAYTRILMHDLHQQKNIDILFCGASHVSHGLNPMILDKRLKKETFCAGTPSQQLDGTYTILREAIKQHKIGKVYVELDFAVAKGTDLSKRKPSEDIFLISHYLTDPAIKFDYIVHSTSPKYYLNSFLPIGMNKLITLDPGKIYKNIKSKATGEYYKYIYKSKNSSYAGKGSILDDDAVENGTFFSNGEVPIPLDELNKNWENRLDSIITLCRINDIPVSFYANPSTDFYLLERQNYDDYNAAVRKFLSKYNLPYYDFSLCKEQYFQLEDHDFSDDNHLNKFGVQKFSDFFCSFEDGTIDKSSLFYPTFKAKMDNQPSHIYGLELFTSEDKKSMRIQPVLNHGDRNKITYDVYIKTNDEKTIIAKGTLNTVIDFPENTYGTITIISYYDGIKQNTVTKQYTSL